MLTGRFSHAFSSPPKTFCRSNFSLRPSFFRFFAADTHYDEFKADDVRGSLAVLACSVLSVFDAETWKLVLFIRHLPQITSEELEHMKKLNPKTEADRAEEEQEEQFLNGGSVPKTPAAEHHH